MAYDIVLYDMIVPDIIYDDHNPPCDSLSVAAKSEVLSCRILQNFSTSDGCRSGKSYSWERSRRGKLIPEFIEWCLEGWLPPLMDNP